jgi:hypothetical protein
LKIPISSSAKEWWTFTVKAVQQPRLLLGAQIFHNENTKVTKKDDHPQISV